MSNEAKCSCDLFLKFLYLVKKIYDDNVGQLVKPFLPKPRDVYVHRVAVSLDFHLR